MRILWLSLAAIFSVVAIVLRLSDVNVVWAGAAIVIAGISLIVGFRERAAQVDSKPIELNGEQMETLRRIRAEGNIEGAIRQVLLWNRYATREQASAFVREFD